MCWHCRCLWVFPQDTYVYYAAARHSALTTSDPPAAPAPSSTSPCIFLPTCTIPTCTHAFACVQVSRLQSTPGLRTVANLPVINGLITSFLPSVILRIFLALLPGLLSFMSHVQGMTSLSQIDFGVMRKYFIFQVGPKSVCMVIIQQRCNIQMYFT